MFARLQASTIVALVSATPALFAQEPPTVDPNGAADVAPANTSGLTLPFWIVNNNASGELVSLRCGRTGAVSTCSSQSNIWVPGGGEARVDVSYTTGGPGVGTLELTAFGMYGDGWGDYTLDVMIPYAVVVTPDGATTPIRQANTSGYSETFTVANTGYYGETYTIGCGGFPNITCTGLSASTLALGRGESQTVTANYSVGGAGTGTLTLTATSSHTSNDGSFLIPVVSRGIAVRAELPARQHFALSGGSQRYFVKNLQPVAVTYTVDRACSGASDCNVTPTSMTLNPGESRVATLTYTVGTAGTTGTAIVKAFDNTFRDSATVALTAIGPPAPLVSIVDVNPGTAIERAACLTVAAGSAAAFECGDLRIIHPLPAIRTLNKARVPTLLYNSAFADPYPIVAASVTLASGSPIPDSVEAVLTVGGEEKARARWAGSDWAGSDWTAGATRRIALGYSAAADTTKVYDYIFEVATIYLPSGRNASAVNGKLIVVNRRGGGFGAGWWLAGVERLEHLPDSNKLWIGGDGSARLYTTAGPNTWVAPVRDRPDTLARVGMRYMRRLPGGLTVQFNAGGQHDTTVNRLGHKTSFAYDTVGSVVRFKSITLPVQGGGQTYTFVYDSNNQLASVTAPAGRVTTISVSALRVDFIRGPDNHLVRFNYENPASRRISARIDRRGSVTSYSYDVAKKLWRSHVALPGDSIRVGFRVLEIQGLATAIPKTATDTANVHTSFFGARQFATGPNFITQETKLWLDRVGSPRRILNVLGHETTIRREDGEWPALATELTAPNGLVTRAGYDARGSIVRSTAVNPLGPSQDAITRYHWDGRWDFADSVITPSGVVTTFAYDTISGNRLWQQVGSDPARRVTFRYGNSQKLLSSTVLPVTPADSIVYDAQWNLAAARTPLGFWTSFYKDALGRDTLLVTPIDSTDKARGGAADSTIRVRQRTVFGAMDRDSVLETIAPNRAQTVRVDKRYDPEGNSTSLARLSLPDPNGIGTITTQWRYDSAGRRVAEVAPDGRKDSTVYDPASNAVRWVTRRDSVVRMEYDPLDRLLKRVVPIIRYAARDQGIPTLAVDQPEDTPYPLYSNDGVGGYRIETDSALFTYDSLSNILTAENSDAKIARSYYRNGLLRSETQRLRTVDGANFDAHVYELQFEYDLDGRRSIARHPAQLAPPLPWKNTVLYDYDGQTGELSWMQGLTWEDIWFHRNLRGEIDTLLYGHAGISEVSVYDADGRLREQRVRNQSSSPYRFADSLLRDARFEYDARGKVLAGRNTRGLRDTLLAEYSGLGHLVRSRLTSHRESQGNDVRFYADERFLNDALANIDSSAQDFERTVNDTAVLNSGSSSENSAYTPGTGRLATSQSGSRSYVYDAAGNTEFMTQIAVFSSPAEDRASYFAADGVLRAVDWRQMIGSGNDVLYRMAFEEYRYDALGRRVLVRARRSCRNADDGECLQSFVRRTVWDGDQELYEIQMPDTPQWKENDSAAVSPMPLLPTLYYPDPNSYYGRVAYVHGPGIDRPLVINRINRAENHHQYGYYMWRTVTTNPLWNRRGLVELGTDKEGGALYCEQDAQGRDRCLLNAWPDGYFAYGRQTKWRAGAWLGSLVEDKLDKAGTLYRRNRHYDPATGRFTQEDPVGIAGGLNLYGFANGDPVTFSDPFGLKADTIPEEMQKKLGNACSVVNCNDVTIKTEPTIPVVDALILAGVRKSGRALTLGNTIYMPAQPDPENSGDVATVAHELVHVYQFGLLEAMHGNRAPVAYLGMGIIDQARYSLGLGNPYTGAGFLEPMAQRVQNCFQGGSCVGAIFTPTGP